MEDLLVGIDADVDFSKPSVVELSAADADKWLPLLSHLMSTESAVGSSASAVDYEEVREIRQRQRRLTDDEATEVIKKYQAGATVYELAAEFDCHRVTIGDKLKAGGITMRGGSPTLLQIDEMVRLYESGLSMARVGERVGVSARSVLKYLQERNVQTRDTHGRTR